ncbi:multidrug efflux system outer membrane protein [Duganella sp. 3397]|uniref:efflux transporter outer membrane subunit n=1 Tax=Duganella sp. 3397 TaxID=2817732 RepID=UPI0028644C8A|nr:efflux transporter outer membrane subunit [Duganella sp. 3397]MDR7048670.1 multidrug efflux system outer membrane protein [Duganella sp. 3397]
MPARLPVFLCTLLLGGCSLAPVYQRPAMPVLPATLGATGIAGVAGVAGVATASVGTAPLNPAEARLLANFAPQHSAAQLSMLTTLVEQALAHNAQYRVAMRRVDEARALARLEGAARLPTVSLQAEGKRTSFDNPDLEATEREHYSAAGIGLDYDLDIFGRLRSMAQAAQDRYAGSEQGAAAVRAGLIAEVLRAHTQLVAGSAALRVLQVTDGYQRQLDAYTQRQFDVGLISRDQLGAQRAATAAHHAATIAAAGRYATAQRALDVLTGYAPAASVGASGGVDALAASPLPLAALRDLDARILLDRPDLRQAEAELKARHADIGAARAAFFPSIRLTTGVGSVSEDLGGLFKSGSRAWTFNPTVSLPIFDGGRNQAQLDAAELRKDAAVASYAQAIEAAFQEVAGALDQQRGLEAEAAARRQRHDTLTRRTGAMALRVAQGLQDSTDLLAEHLRTEDAALARIDAARDLALNRIRLLHAFYGTTFSLNLPITQDSPHHD